MMLTGERTIPGLDIENYWFRRHEVVYQRLAERCVDADVLEAGCGEEKALAIRHPRPSFDEDAERSRVDELDG